MLYFLFSILEKKACLYIYIHNDFDACNEFCIVLLYILPYVHIRIYIYMYIIYIYIYNINIYIYIHTLFDKFIVFSQ